MGIDPDVTCEKTKPIKANCVQSPNNALSLLPRIQVRDKLQQESRPLDTLGFRIKCGMTRANGIARAQRNTVLQNKANLANSVIHVNIVSRKDYGNRTRSSVPGNKANSPGFARKSEALSSKR